jgi:hypothetical protein
VSRFTGWHRRSGDVDASPQHRDAAKKLLGEIADAQRLGAPPVLVRQRVMPDGTVVEATIRHGLASTRIIQSRVERERVDDLFLGGLVARPRSRADQNAFGTKSDVILTPGRPGTDTEAWRSTFYDATYGPKRFYGVNRIGQELFADGIPESGNNDWRSADELTSVNWVGPGSRYFPEGLPWGRWVYRNGEVLFATDDLPGFSTSWSYAVLSAAVRITTDGPVLLVCVYYEPNPHAHFFRFYRAPIVASETTDTWFAGVTLRAPRWAKVAPGAAELLLEIEVPEFENARILTPFQFNQSATQARAILWLIPDAFDKANVTEVAVDLSDLSSVTHTSDVVELTQTTTTTSTYDTVRYNGYTGFYYGVDFPDPVVVGPGTYAGTPTSIPQLESDGIDLPPHYDFLPLESVRAREIAFDPIEVKGAVDFIDDTPVYAYVKLNAETRTNTRSATATYTSTGSSSGTRVVDVTLDTTDDVHHEWSNTAEANCDDEGTADGNTLGLRCTDAVGATWLDVSPTLSGSYSRGANSSLTRTTSRDLTGAVGHSGVYDATEYDTSTITGDYSFGEEVTRTIETNTLNVWFLDLRYRAAAYSLLSEVEVRTSSASGTGTLAGDESTHTTDTKSTDTDVSRERDWTLATHVLFGGVEVASTTATKSDTSSDSFTQTADFPSPNSNAIAEGWRALQETLPIIAEGGISDVVSASAFTTAHYPGSTEDTFDYDDLEDVDVAPPTRISQDFWVNNHFDTIDVLADIAPYDAWIPAGLWCAYRGSWCYSMTWIAGAITPGPIAWSNVIRNGQDLDSLTGSHGMDMLGALWPFSLCLYETLRTSETSR